MSKGRKMCKYKQVDNNNLLRFIRIKCSNPNLSNEYAVQDKETLIKKCCARLCPYYESK